MKKMTMLLAACVLAACAHNVKPATGESVPDLGWLFTGSGPYTLNTRVAAVPGPGLLEVVADIHLLEDQPEVLMAKEVTVSADSSLTVELGHLEPGFYQLRLRDTVLRWNIGVRPDEVVSPPDAADDFDAFWETTLTELAEIPLEPELTAVPAYSNELRTCYEVRYPSYGGALSGGILSAPNAPGKYPVEIVYMGYNAAPFYFDPSAAPERIQYLVSVREQGIYRTPEARWIDQGLAGKETFYYRGAFADAKRAVDFVASLDQAAPSPSWRRRWTPASRPSRRPSPSWATTAITAASWNGRYTKCWPRPTRKESRMNNCIRCLRTST